MRCRRVTAVVSIGATLLVWAMMPASSALAARDGIVAAAQTPSSRPVPLSDGWTRLRMPSFTVTGNATRDQLTDAARRIERFRQAMQAIAPEVPIELPVPLTVVVLKNEEAFRPFVWPSGRGKVGGYFSHDGEAAFMVFPAWTGDFGASVVFHEYAHVMVRRTMGDVPPWLGEGLAELYSTFGGTARDDRHLIGRPIDHHIDQLRQRPLVPFEALLRADGGSWSFSDPNEARQFYAQAWAFVHYLVIGDRGRRQPALVGFVNAQRGGEPFEAAFIRHFGMLPDEMEATLRQYVRQVSMHAVEIALPRARPVSHAVERMTEVEALQLQARVQLRIGELASSERNLEAALRLDAASLPARVTLGRLLLARERPAEAVEKLSAAAADADVDPAVAAALADALREVGRYDEAIAAYDRATALGAKAPAVFFGLGVAAMARERWARSAVAFATLRALDPDPEWQAQRALSALRLGHGLMAADAARVYLRQSPWTATSGSVALAGALGSLLAGRADRGRPFLDDLIAHGKSRPWASVLARFLSGEMSGEALLQQASDRAAQTDGHAAVACRELVDGRFEEATAHLLWVKVHGSRESALHPWAVSALNRLEAGAWTPPR